MTHVVVHNVKDLTPEHIEHLRKLAAVFATPITAHTDPDGTYLAVDDDDDQEGD